MIPLIIMTASVMECTVPANRPPGISSAQQLRYARQYRDLFALLVESQTGHVKSAAKSFLRGRPHIDFDDIIQEGMAAVTHAVRRFDPDKGFQLSTICGIAIRNAMINYVTKKTVNYIAPQEAPESDNSTRSEDEDGEDAVGIDMVESEPMGAADAREMLAETMPKLPCVAREVLIRRDGLFHQTPQSFAEIGKELGIPVSYARAWYGQGRAMLRELVKGAM